MSYRLFNETIVVSKGSLLTASDSCGEEHSSTETRHRRSATSRILATGAPHTVFKPTTDLTHLRLRLTPVQACFRIEKHFKHPTSRLTLLVLLSKLFAPTAQSIIIQQMHLVSLNVMNRSQSVLVKGEFVVNALREQLILNKCTWTFT